MLTTTITTLEDMGTSALSDVFNNAFADYVLPMHMTEESLSFKILSESIDLSLSVGALNDEGKLVSVMLTGIRTDEDGTTNFYNSITGVIPEYRGQRLVERMYAHAMPLWKCRCASGTKGSLVLEVIVGNERAVKAYTRQGYTVQRGLLWFNGVVTTEALTQRSSSSSNSKISQKQSPPVVRIAAVESPPWAIVQTFWDVMPSWESSVPTLTLAQDVIRYRVASVGSDIVGYIAFHESSGEVYQIAVSKAYRRRGIGSLLLAAAVEAVGKQHVLITGIEREKGSDIIAFCKSVGLENFISEYEMGRLL